MIEGLRARPWILGLVTTLAVVVVWQLTPALGWVDRQFIPPATAVFGSFAAEWGEWAFYPDLLSTLFRILAGFALAAIIGIPLGLAMGYWRMAYRLFGLTVEVLRPIPASALVPVAAIAFGIGHSMHIVVIFIATAVPILLSTVDGVRDVDPILISTARVFRRSTGQIFRTVLLPAAFPHIVTGLRVGIAIALIVGISSEMIMSAEGLGRRVLYAQRMLRIPDLYAGILTLATVGYLLNHAFLLVETRLLRWHRHANAKTWA
jgi:ABC-type nitrate/sulfonate/bicarbonate transport system permease component